MVAWFFAQNQCSLNNTATEVSDISFLPFPFLKLTNTAALSLDILSVTDFGALILESPWRRGPFPCLASPTCHSSLNHLLVENLNIGLKSEKLTYIYSTALYESELLKTIRFWNQSCPCLRACKQFVRKCPSNKRYFESLQKDYLLHVNQASQSMCPVRTSESSARIYPVRARLARRHCMSKRSA